ncbi:DUF4157 domain-containing protein [Nonomuraea sp. B1E8]|uniref:eCIS core domain-containing protein n=1 Tax=unclassified Nonomuraea TaxID=2593643 RepID=UPI00325EDFB5
MRIAESTRPPKSADLGEPECARDETLMRAHRRSATPPHSRHSVARIPVHAPPDPAAERDAHATAAHVVATERATRRSGTPMVADGRQDRVKAAARPGGPITRVATVPDSRLGPGRPLTGAERARYEPALGMSLAGVRLHDGLAAKLAAKERRAHAFTYGNHVVLGSGAAPHATPGRDLVLAHELAHVRQQARPAAHPAGTTADHPGRGPPAPPARSAPLGVQCFELADTHVGRFVTNTASDVAAMGHGALDTAREVRGEITGSALETASVVADRLAPGLLELLRGGALGQVRELLCTGVTTLAARLLSRLDTIDPMSDIETAFTRLANDVGKVQAKLGDAARATVGTLLRPVVDALQEWEGPILQNLRSATATVNDLFLGFWDHLAVPALDLLGNAGGAAWEGFTRLSSWLWELGTPIRAGPEYVWKWLTTQFGLAWESSAGVREWLANLASSAWEKLRAAIAPIRTPLMVAAGALVMLTPLGPIVVLTQVLPPLWDKLTWLWENWNFNDILVAARQVLQERILPVVIDKVSAAADTMTAAATWLADAAGQVDTAMSGLCGAFGTNACLSGVSYLLTRVAGQFARMAAWARGGFSGLVKALRAVFDALLAIFRPILDFLVRLAKVVANPLMLPVALTSAIWMLCPDDLKPPVIAFVLDLLITTIGGMPVLLPGLGPLGVLVQEGVVGFLLQLRHGEKVDDQQRVEASNKIASLAAGGGLAFLAGMAWGIVQGVVDGIIDPFRLLFMLAELLVAGSRAVVRVIERYAPALAMPRPPTSPTGTGTAKAAPATPSAADAAGGTAAQLAPVPSEPTDAEIIPAMSQDRLNAVAADGMQPDVDPATVENTMRDEVKNAGTTVKGLGELLGEAWTAMVAGAQSLGAKAASALLGFILLPDYELGKKIGFVTGFVLLQALVMYLTAGGYTTAKAAETPLRMLLRYLLRFLDLGGELFGVLGRALRPLGKPLMTGIGSARKFLSRFRFAADFLTWLESRAGRMLGLSDEAANAASRATREGVESGAKRTTLEAAEAGAAKEAAGEAGQRAATKEAGELGEGALRAVDEPGVPTVADDIAKEAQYPEALGRAEMIKELNDAVDTPVPIMLGLLMTLKRRYRWIETFTATPIGPSVYAVEMVASHTPLGQYTTNGPRETRESLSRIAQKFQEELRTNPAIRTRFRQIAESAHADPEGAARAAVALEQRLTSRTKRGVADVFEQAQMPGRGIDPRAVPEGLSPLKKPPGAVPIESEVKAKLGETGHALETGTIVPRRANEVVSGARQAEVRAKMLSRPRGDRRLAQLAAEFPPEGAAQVFLPTGRGGGRYIDHMFMDGPTVVLRESKNVTRFSLSRDPLRPNRNVVQLKKDLEILAQFTDCRVEWRITGAMDDATRETLDLLVGWYGGRFRYVHGAF